MTEPVISKLPPEASQRTTLQGRLLFQQHSSRHLRAQEGVVGPSGSDVAVTKNLQVGISDARDINKRIYIAFLMFDEGNGVAENDQLMTDCGEQQMALYEVCIAAGLFVT